MTRIEKIQHRLQQLSPVFLEVIDESWQHEGHGHYDADGSHFLCRISSNLFEEKSLVECHRLVYAALGDMIPREVHALRIEIVRD